MVDAAESGQESARTNTELPSNDAADVRTATMPERYIIGCNGDEVEAKRRWAATLAWRERENIDSILQEPQPFYDVCKQGFPTFLYGSDKQVIIANFRVLCAALHNPLLCSAESAVSHCHTQLFSCSAGSCDAFQKCCNRVTQSSGSRWEL
jgi:hypothetical protein